LFVIYVPQDSKFRISGLFNKKTSLLLCTNPSWLDSLKHRPRASVDAGRHQLLPQTLNISPSESQKNALSILDDCA
jgi:hypothetical protein